MATQKSDSTSADLHTDDVASFLDLKTEFIRRRDAALTNKRNYDGISQNSTNILQKKVKTNILAISKEEKRTKNELSAQRTQRIRQNEELLRKEEQQRVNQRKILENKAAIYERMSRGEKLVYEDGKEAEFLVNFEVKKRELEAKGCGSVQNSRTVAEDDDLTDEELRRSDDEREGSSKEPAPLIIHYDPTEEKGRVFGASHVILPTNEEAREKKITELKSMTEETNKERLKRKKQRSAKKAEERRRLNRLRQRMGLPLLESSDEEQIEEKKKEETEDQKTPESSQLDEGNKKELDNPVKYGIREWDRGKVGYMRWVEGRREEREEEFAPPRLYFQNK